VHRLAVLALLYWQETSAPAATCSTTHPAAHVKPVTESSQGLPEGARIAADTASLSLAAADWPVDADWVVLCEMGRAVRSAGPVTG